MNNNMEYVWERVLYNFRRLRVYLNKVNAPFVDAI